MDLICRLEQMTAVAMSALDNSDLCALRGGIEDWVADEPVVFQ